MKSNVEKLIKIAVGRLEEESELRRMTLSNIIHLNMDILINNAPLWFGNKIPEEFKNVLHSLITVTTTLFEEKPHLGDISIDLDYEELDLAVIMKKIIGELELMFMINSIKLLSADENCKIVASGKILLDSLYHIFLAVYMFIDDNSRCTVSIARDSSNVKAEIKFFNLAESYPGLNKIQKVLFTYYQGSKYNVGIGLSTPINTLRDMGAIVYVRNFTSENNLVVSVSFPSIEFLNTIDEIRSSGIILERRFKKQGNVLIIVKDVMVEIVLKEMLFEEGYQVSKIVIDELEGFDDYGRYKCIIVDYACIMDNFLTLKIFSKYTENFAKVIIIYDEENAADLTAQSSGYSRRFILLKKPVEIDEIINNIEGGVNP